MMKLFGYFFLIYIFFTIVLTAQITEPRWFSYQAQDQNNNESFILGLPNNDIMMFWYDSLEIKIKSARSTDNGISWHDSSSIATFLSPSNYSSDINGIVLNSGRVLLTYRTDSYYYIYSDDDCVSWSEPMLLPARIPPPLRRGVNFSSLGKSSNGSIVFVHSFTTSSNRNEAKGIYTISSLDGTWWSAVDTIDVAGRNGNLVNLGASKDMIVYHDSTTDDNDIFYRITTDAGQTWSQKELLIGGINHKKM